MISRISAAFALFLASIVLAGCLGGGNGHFVSQHTNYQSLPGNTTGGAGGH